MGGGLHQALRHRAGRLRHAAAHRQGERPPVRRAHPSGDALTRTHAFRAPGRVNLIGEHTDYGGGLVLPAAVELGVTVLGEPGGDTIELESDRFPADEGWRRYVDAVAAELDLVGRPSVGFRGRVLADLPAGAGLSSSAALEVAVALALCEAAGFEVDRLELAALCRRAEEQAVGVPCGLMDQAASLLARSGHALLLDCGTLEHRHVRFPADLELLVVDSGSPRRLAESGYARRRAEVEAGDPRRLRHVRSENERVGEVVAALETGDRVALQRAFAASHASLRDDFEVSTPELDALVASALAAGAVAARMTGAGFGGSIVALVEAGTGEEVGRAVDASFFVTRPAGAARSIRPARPDEAAAAAALVERAYGHYVERIGRRPAPMDDDYDALVSAGELWLLHDRDLAGLVVLRAVEAHLLVDNVAVDPRRQGEGLGRALLEFAETEAIARGIHELRLLTNVAMTENIALYRRLGWEEYDRRIDGPYSRVYFRRPVGTLARSRRHRGGHMAGKADFTEQEWEALQKGVTGAGLLVSVSDKGFVDTFKEAGALAKHLNDAREGHDSQLVRELSQVRGTGFGLSASPDEVERETIESLGTATAILQAKAPDELDAYRSFVVGVAESVAQAAKGVGAGETVAIERIRTALDSA